MKFTEEQKMATVREHLEQFHSEMSKCHTAAMGKSAEPEFHKAAAAVHDAFKEACAKAASDELEKARSQVVPTRVSAVTPTPPGVTAVPRAGQRQLGKTVDPEFASLVSSGDDRTE
jgi:hypothetical protein